jgi:hypothetical protein
MDKFSEAGIVSMAEARIERGGVGGRTLAWDRSLRIPRETNFIVPIDLIDTDEPRTLSTGSHSLLQ